MELASGGDGYTSGSIASASERIPFTAMYLGVDEGMGLKRPPASSSPIKPLHSRTSPLSSHSSTSLWNRSSLAVKNCAAWSNTSCSPLSTNLVAILPPRPCIPCVSSVPVR